MDEFKDFFDLSKDFKRIVISAGPVNGRIIANRDWDQAATRRENDEPDYASQFQSDQEAIMLEVNYCEIFMLFSVNFVAIYIKKSCVIPFRIYYIARVPFQLRFFCSKFCECVYDFSLIFTSLLDSFGSIYGSI